MTKVNTVVTNGTDAHIDMYNKRQALLAEIAKIDAQFKADGVEFHDGRFWSFLDESVRKIDNALLNNRVVRFAARSVLGTVCKSVLALQEVTRHRVRLYTVEGRHLSIRDNETQTRMTWYMDSMEALEIGVYMGNSTGKLVEVELELDFCSDYSFTWNKANKHIYTLKGDLIKAAKRKWKYTRTMSSPRVAVTQEV